MSKFELNTHNKNQKKKKKDWNLISIRQVYIFVERLGTTHSQNNTK